MNDYLIKVFDQFIKRSNTIPTKIGQNWKIFVVLSKLGWTATYNCTSGNNNDICVTMIKDNKPSIKIQLSFADQCRIINYFEMRKK
jgi:hypothetical protein